MPHYKPKPPQKPYYLVHGADNTYYACRAEKPMLSLKCMFNGPAIYETDDGGRFSVDDNTYLILNQEQPYTLVKDGVRPVESFCVFFSEALVEDVVGSSTAPDALLLDEPLHDAKGRFNFFERLYSHDQLVSPIVQSIRSESKQRCVNKDRVEENLHDLLLAMIQTQTNLFRKIEQLPPARYATRVELYRRLTRARDYIHATLSEPHSLTDIARVVHLSPHHFLRSFKELFGVTPHAYLTQIRIDRAQYLLAHTAMSVTEICLDVGYESPSSFSNLFRRETGVSPRTYRQLIAR